MMKDIETLLANKLQYKFYRAVLRELEEDRTQEIHVTDLVYDCLRRAYYSKKHPIHAADEASALVLWIGKKLHETIVCEDGHEVEVELQIADEVSVKGSIDEMCQIDGYTVIIDKKTTRNIPSKPYDHHVKQVKIYAMILYKTRGIRVQYGGILYIDVNNLYSKLYMFPVQMLEIEQLYNEVVEKAWKLYIAMKENTAPEAEPGWICKYCPYWQLCVQHGIGGGENA